MEGETETEREREKKYINVVVKYFYSIYDISVSYMHIFDYCII